MEVNEGEVKKELAFPADIFEPDDLRQRRAELFKKGIRSRLILHAETDDTVAYYDLILVGPKDEVVMSGLMFSYFDDTELFNPFRDGGKHRPHKMG